ncbi:hypothetical protein HanRHA438_Chr01g0001031 [Helianthus annuus]|uniref:Cotton fiber protein n=1 Tax=Helianthus annuus TaxID=4232 RepID=A0A9K3JS89_HELAN|nr:uncharacterized protein LOC110941426 [Helianthus annuus]KAF5820322.1 hypothetical protein HanXRQr2_Chr01g0000931 [Helianthus annuus]KAJ0620781.1 hypothetical protein HanIR_Chr01g0001331 [Helianthus annuus]KAJ0625367.1 hypothetical protein HanHA89_Chr01g0000871 [Helianthus annuus]KAJ0781788.1 hypothetical protein HanLR1_Chr01g0000811 [Helianthus annuus]KAJ0946167.1 hypothetical protein HanRHA438_Chr01g0001031 [Helianthus annuus]
MQIMKKTGSRSDVSRRAWRLLRLALLWVRKGGVFVLKKRLMLDLSHYVKSLGQSKKGNGALQYGDRQLSFDATPMIHVRMHRPNSMRFRLPHIPCINPHVECSDHLFDFDDESEGYSCCEARKSFLIGNGEEYDEEDDDDEYDQITSEEQTMGIDLRAEEFIANFYEQLKLQRQHTTRRRRD